MNHCVVCYAWLKMRMMHKKISFNEVEQKLTDIESYLCEVSGNRVVFSFFFPPSKEVYASLSRKFIIRLNYSWAYYLVADPEIIDHVIVTVGHERTHYDLICSGIKNDSSMILRYIEEVYCDFNGVSLLLDKDRKKFIAACEFKRSLKSNDKNSLSHPSWENRIKYAKKYNFDEKLISDIISDSKIEFTEQEIKNLIVDVFEKYSKIHLLPTIEK